ncbi:MAG: GNAT family N-acetyltransferase [Vulcanimicrobiaceae bacterium]
MSLEIVRRQDESAERFLGEHEREALRTFYGFPVVPHEQTHSVSALADGVLAGVGRMRISASLGRIEAVVVEAAHRRRGIGRALVDGLAEIARYYNCHKLTIEVPHRSAAQAFFQACGFHEEVVLPQHDFKIDMAVMRKFLL